MLKWSQSTKNLHLINSTDTVEIFVAELWLKPAWLVQEAFILRHIQVFNPFFLDCIVLCVRGEQCLTGQPVLKPP